jgi:hypothetical protein
MGIGRDSANFVKRGILTVLLGVFTIGLTLLTGYFGYKFLRAHYETSPYYTVILLGFFVGTMIFGLIVEKYIVQVLFKGK